MHFHKISLHFLHSFLPFIDNIGPWGYLVIGVISFIEALPLVGLFTPGVTILLFFGFVSSQGYVDIPYLILAATIGAVSGDFVGFYLGTKGTHLFHEENKILKVSHLERGKKFFSKHGGKSVFLGRFLSPIRSIVPLIAGIVKMPFVQFCIWNILGAIVWSSLYLTLGYLFGYNLAYIEKISTRIGFVFFVIIIFFVISRVLRHKAQVDK